MNRRWLLLRLVGGRNEAPFVPSGAAFHGIEGTVSCAAMAVFRRRGTEIEHQEHADGRSQRCALVLAERNQRAQLMNRAILTPRDFFQSPPHFRLQPHRGSARTYRNVSGYQCTSRTCLIITLQLMIRHGYSPYWRFNYIS